MNCLFCNSELIFEEESLGIDNYKCNKCNILYEHLIHCNLKHKHCCLYEYWFNINLFHRYEVLIYPSWSCSYRKSTISIYKVYDNDNDDYNSVKLLDIKIDADLISREKAEKYIKFLIFM